MTMRIEFNRDRCSGHAQCAAAAPEVYPLDDGGYCIVENGEVASGLEELAQAGADNCPEQAITIIR